MPLTSPYNKALQKGFTLLEIMVVITIVAFLSTAVVLTLPDEQQKAKYSGDQKAKLTAMMRGLSQKAIIEQRWYGLLLTQTSYQSMIFSDKKWQKAPASTTKHVLEGVSFSLLINNQLQPLSADEEALAHQTTAIKETPQIRISPSGLFTAFEITIEEALQNITLSDPYAQI